MNGGSISNNQAYCGGGVFIYQNGTFEMNDGSITNNSSTYGGGVNNMFGKFTMNDGEISENTASGNGGGVYTSKNNSAAEYVFIMNGGSISNNTADESGGGVCINDYDAEFTMENFRWDSEESTLTESTLLSGMHVQ